MYRYTIYNEVKDLKLYLSYRAISTKIYKVIFHHTLHIETNTVQCIQNMSAHFSRAERMIRTDHTI